MADSTHFWLAVGRPWRTLRLVRRMPIGYRAAWRITGRSHIRPAAIVGHVPPEDR